MQYSILLFILSFFHTPVLANDSKNSDFKKETSVEKSIDKNKENANANENLDWASIFYKKTNSATRQHLEELQKTFDPHAAQKTQKNDSIKDNIKKALLKEGMDINRKDKTGLNLLHYVTLNTDSISLIKFLLSKGANVNETTKLGQTALHHAVIRHHTNVVQFLTHVKNINLNQKDIEGQTPIYYATHQPEAQYMVNILLRYGADIETKDKTGLTPFLSSVKYEKYALAEILAKEGANLNAVDSKDNTAFHYLAMNISETNYIKISQETILQLLFTKNVDLQIENDKGKTVLQIAQEGQNSKLLQILKKAMNKKKKKNCKNSF